MRRRRRARVELAPGRLLDLLISGAITAQPSRIPIEQEPVTYEIRRELGETFLLSASGTAGAPWRIARVDPDGRETDLGLLSELIQPVGES